MEAQAVSVLNPAPDVLVLLPSQCSHASVLGRRGQGGPLGGVHWGAFSSCGSTWALHLWECLGLCRDQKGRKVLRWEAGPKADLGDSGHSGLCPDSGDRIDSDAAFWADLLSCGTLGLRMSLNPLEITNVSFKDMLKCKV